MNSDWRWLYMKRSLVTTAATSLAWMIVDTLSYYFLFCPLCKSIPGIRRFLSDVHPMPVIAVTFLLNLIFTGTDKYLMQPKFPSGAFMRSPIRIMLVENN